MKHLANIATALVVVVALAWSVLAGFQFVRHDISFARLFITDTAAAMMMWLAIDLNLRHAHREEGRS